MSPIPAAVHVPPATAARQWSDPFARVAHDHARSSQSLLGILRSDDRTISWLSGGIDFPPFPGRDTGLRSLPGILSGLGVAAPDVSRVLDTVDALGDGGAEACAKLRFAGDGGREFSLFLRRRDDAQGPLQFTLGDISVLAGAERRHRAMATAIVEAFDRGAPSPAKLLAVLREGIGHLNELSDTEAVSAHARALAAATDRLVETCIAILRGFEADTAGSIGSASRQEIREQPQEDEPSPSDLHAARSFVRNAVPTFLLALPERGILVLNGPTGGAAFHDVAALIRGLGVGENSIRSASAFFADIAARPAQATFAIGSMNMEARGRPRAGGGWQALLSPAVTDAVDVRGMFHGLKNLLLHLQVLHVVRTPADVGQVAAPLREALGRIDERLTFLRRLSETGNARLERRTERVADWIAAARMVGRETGREVIETLAPEISALTYMTVPGDMEDVFAELARNAFEHGASRLVIEGLVHGHCLVLTLTDDGPGMPAGKIDQVRTVLATRRHDPTLSTRPDGTGNGLLGAAIAVSRFVDGSLDVDRGPEGWGTVFRIVMALPEGTSRGAA